MNYSSECIENNNILIKNLLKLGMAEDAEKIALVNLSIAESHKFIFPSPDQLNINVTYDSLSVMKLPYPTMAFEYTLPALTDEDVTKEKESPETVSSKKMVLAFDCSKDVWPVNYFKKTGKLNPADDGIFVLLFNYSDYTKTWWMDDWGGYFGKNLFDELPDFDKSKELLITQGKANLPIKVIDLLEDYPKHLVSQHGSSCEVNLLDKQQIIGSSVAFSILATLMLNTKNLKPFKLVDAPEKLNKKRIKNNKTPFFSYHTLDLFFSNSGTLVDRKKINYGVIQEQINNSNVMKRWGTVRGHFKVRNSGIFWWNNHTRGNKINGIIEKDYAIKPEKKLTTIF